MIGKHMSAKERLLSYKMELGLVKKTFCSQEESAKYEQILNKNEILPEGVFVQLVKGADGNSVKREFFTLHESDTLTDKEIKELLLHEQLKSTKKSKIFFILSSVFTIINTVILLLILLQK